jgi:hypothetical protein
MLLLELCIYYSGETKGVEKERNLLIAVPFHITVPRVHKRCPKGRGVSKNG